MTPRPRRRAFTLLEVVVSGFLLALLAVPLMGMLQGSSRSVRRVDARREGRHLLERILDRVEATDFLILYDNFGIEPESPDRMQEGLTQGGRTPLLLTTALRDTLEEGGWQARLTFRFMTKEEVGEDPENPVKTSTGILHLQGAWVTLSLGRKGQPTLRIRKPLYCPLILGRPGLMLSQCPALNQGLRRDLFSHIP